MSAARRLTDVPSKKAADFVAGFDLLLNKPTGRGKPRRLRSASTSEPADAPAQAAVEGIGELDVDASAWEELGAELDTEEETLSSVETPGVRVQVRLPLRVHLRLTDFLERGGLTVKQFFYRIVIAEISSAIPARARRIRLPKITKSTSALVQAKLPKDIHQKIKARAVEYDNMALNALLTRLILYRLARGRKPKAVRQLPEDLRRQAS